MIKKLLFINFLLVFFAAFQSIAQTQGTLTWSFTPTSHIGFSGDARHVLAVWVESSTGNFVKTKMKYCCAGQTGDHLPTWAAKSGCSNPNNITSSTGCNITDATTGATLASYATRSGTWDGKNVNGTVNGTTVADGAYRLAVQETWAHGTSATTTVYYNFTKGPTATHAVGTADANFSAITLDWVPFPTGIDEVNFAQANASVYPNPSRDGNVTIHYSNANKIRITNILGTAIANYKVALSAEENDFSVDLSAYANGIYMVQVSNDQSVTTYKVLVNK
jgi:hypothetical protein